MKVSANEVMTLAAKAARGAGAPPSQAAMFGRAALHHLVEGRPHSTLVEALEALPSGPILSLPVAFLRLVVGETTEIPQGPPDLVQSYAEAQSFAVTLDGVAGTANALAERPAARPVVSRVSLNDDFAETLGALAARTFVPDSQGSRSGGAGAGLHDND